MQKYTRVPNDTFKKLVINAGILVNNFYPETGEIGDILGATTGGIEFSSNPEFVDYGEDVDNVPNNTKELKRITQFDPQMSGMFLTCTPAVIKTLIGAGDVSATDQTRVIPRSELLNSDFEDLWWIGDYSDVNTGVNAGFLAIHLMNALNTSGFHIQSSKNEKGQMSFEFHGHYSLNDMDTVPFEIYCKAGSSTVNPTVLLDKHTVTVEVEGTEDLSAMVIPEDAEITWSSASGAVATVADGIITGVATGNTIITAAITVEGVTYNDTCTVIVTAAS